MNKVTSISKSLIVADEKAKKAKKKAKKNPRLL